MKLLSAVAFLFLLFSCCGWGYLLTRWVHGEGKNQFAFMSVVGLACLVFIGGLFNLARLAFLPVLGVLLLAGASLFVICYTAKIRNWQSARRAARPTGTIAGAIPAHGKIMGFLPLVILSIAAGFYAWALLPADAFNIYDDFYTYIPRPLRMLQTGTLAGNPYDILGLDSLGAGSFLQGFVLLGFPIQYLLSFDAVFSFVMAGLLLIAIGRKFGLHWIYSAAAILVFMVINPQPVNISAIYISAAIILGIFYVSCLLLEEMGRLEGNAIPKMAIWIFGLLFACLIALKITFIIYSIVYFFVFFLGLLLISPARRKVLRVCGLTILATFAALLPWLMLHAASYASAIQIALHSSTESTGRGFFMMDGEITKLFSMAELFYGDSFLSYGMIVLELAVVGCYSLSVIFTGRFSATQRGYFLIAAAACAAAVVNYFFNGMIFAPENAIRYSCPVLIAALPFALLALSMAAANREQPARLFSLSGLRLVVVPTLSLLIVVLFWNNLTVRVGQAYYQHNTIPYAPNEGNLAYNRFVLSPESKQVMRAIQSRTQPGQKILAWVSMPLHLDFSRNEIYSVMFPGLLNPWLDMPLNGNVQDVTQYLRGQGIRYIMWEYNGYAMPTEDKFREMLSYPYRVYRRIGERNLYLRKMLESMTAGGDFLYHANGVVLFDLQQVK